MSYGADDLHGTIIEEHIFHMAGLSRRSCKPRRNDQGHPRDRFTPVQRNTFYEPIKVLENPSPATAEAEPPSGKSKVLEDNLATA